MHFSTKTFASLAISSTLLVQLLGSPVPSIDSRGNGLSRRAGFGFKPPKDPDAPDVPAAGPAAGRIPGSTGGRDPSAAGSLGQSEGKTPEQIQETGVYAQKLLDDAIKSNKPIKTGVPDIFASASAYKISKEENYEMSDLDVYKTVLEPPGAAPVKYANQDDIKYTKYEVQSKEGAEANIVETQMSKDEGIMHYPWRMNKWDKATDADKVVISDQMWQLWRDAPSAKGVGPDNLKVATALTIVNEETIDLVKAAHLKAGLGQKEGATGTWNPGSAEFDQFMGSDNGRPLARMLADYHSELGNLKVIQIKSTYGEEPDYPNLMYYLGKS